jgi:hypothetical protein
MMCITNDDATRNGNKRNDVMKKKKMLGKGKGKHNKKEMMKKITKVTTKMKEKNDKKKNP